MVERPPVTSSANDAVTPSASPCVVRVEVALAEVGQVFLCELDLPRGTSAGEALQIASAMATWPRSLSVDLECLGVFSRRVSADYVLIDGDRLECYRPLKLDPMEARRRRATRAR